MITTDLPVVGSPFLYYVTMLQRYVYPLMLAIGFFGNITSFLVLNLPANKKNVMCFYLRALAVCDMIALTTFLLPKFIFNLWPDLLLIKTVGDVVCVLFHYIPYIFCDASIWLIPIIALDRFIVVKYPLKASQWCTVKRAKILISVDILIHIVLYLPNGIRKASLDGASSYVTCLLPESLAWFGLVFDIINTSVDVILPMSLVFFLNIGIINVLRRHRTELKETAAVESKARAKQERALTIMLLAVATFLMILLLPYTIDFIAWNCCLQDLMRTKPGLRQLTFEISFELVQLNNALNFVMYFVSSPKFRKDLRTWFSGKVDYFSSFSGSSSEPQSTKVFKT